MDADELADQFEDKASVRAAAGKTGGGRKAGGGGGGKSKPGDGGKQREKQISMALSRLLRHQALNAGIKLDKEGYAPLDRVVSVACSFSSSYGLAVLFFSCASRRMAASCWSPPQYNAVCHDDGCTSIYLSSYMSALFHYLEPK